MVLDGQPTASEKSYEEVEVAPEVAPVKAEIFCPKVMLVSTV